MKGNDVQARIVKRALGDTEEHSRFMPWIWTSASLEHAPSGHKHVFLYVRTRLLCNYNDVCDDEDEADPPLPCKGRNSE